VSWGRIALAAVFAGGAVAAFGALPAYGTRRLSVVRSRTALGSTGPTWAWPAGRAAQAVLLALGALLGGLVGGVALALLTVAGLLATRRVLESRRRQAAERREKLRAGEACVVLAGELRAGRAPADALEAAARLAEGPTRQVLLAAAAAGRLGGDVPVALSHGASASAAPELLRGLSACWRVCSQAGSGLAAAVDRLADAVVARHEQDRAVETALAGPRATALVLAVLPLGGVGLAAALGARPWHVLFGTPAGFVCLFVGCALDVLGLWWTNQLVARARVLP